MHASRNIIEQHFLAEKWRNKKSFVQVSFSAQVAFWDNYDLLLSSKTIDVERKNDSKRFILTKPALMKKINKKVTCSKIFEHETFLFFFLWTWNFYIFFCQKWKQKVAESNKRQLVVKLVIYIWKRFRRRENRKFPTESCVKIVISTGFTQKDLRRQKIQSANHFAFC